MTDKPQPTPALALPVLPYPDPVGDAIIQAGRESSKAGDNEQEALARSNAAIHRAVVGGCANH